MEKKKFDVEFHGTNLFALVPLLLFVVFCILFFVVFKTFDMMHLCMGGYVALIIGSLLSKNWGKYWDAVATGMSSKIMNELALILLIVGMFGKLMTRGGVAQGFVWLGDKIGLSGGGFVAFTFIATCVIATATGTSIGTMFTAFPILYPSGLLLGADPVFLAGAILSGAIFGDNVGPISDTTIASASTQEYTNKPGVADVAGVVGSRMKYALVAAAAATVCFALFGGSGSAINAAEAEAILAQYSNPKGLIMLIPVAILLIVAFIKRNIYVACTWGLISGTIIGLVSGILVPSDISGAYQSAVMAARELREEYPQRRLAVFDTRAASLGEGIQVLHGATCREAGFTLDETMRELAALRPRIRQIFTVDDLMHLRRGGRVSGVAAAVGTALRIKPLLKGDAAGRIVVFGKVQGRKRAVRSLADNFAENAELLGHWPVGIAHAGCRDEALELAATLHASDPKARIIVVDYEPVTGSHVGPGALAMFYVAREDARPL